MVEVDTLVWTTGFSGLYSKYYSLLKNLLDIDQLVNTILEVARGGTMKVDCIVKYVVLVTLIICSLGIAGYTTQYCQSNKVNVRAEPNTNAEILGVLAINDPVIPLGESGQWYRIDLSKSRLSRLIRGQRRYCGSHEFFVSV